MLGDTSVPSRVTNGADWVPHGRTNGKSNGSADVNTDAIAHALAHASANARALMLVIPVWSRAILVYKKSRKLSSRLYLRRLQ